MWWKKGNIVVVDLSKNLSHNIQYSDIFLKKYIGGRGFNSKILYELRHLYPKVTDPYHIKNVICVSSGPLSNTSFPSSSRTTVSVLKSPVTNKFCDGNLGGFFGHYLRMAGIDALIIIGKAKKPCYIHITEDGILEIKNIPYTVWMYTNTIVQKYLSIRNSPYSTKSLTIGPAGAKQVFCATVSCDNRTAGQGGLGAVFGSKNLKSISVSISKEKKPTTSPKFEELCAIARNKITTHPIYSTFRQYGTTSLVEVHASLRYLPSLNFIYKTWEKWKLISGKALLDITKSKDSDFLDTRKKLNNARKLGCRLCPILCSGPEKIEYETLNCLGSKIGVDDLSWILRINQEYMNEQGVDVIQTTSIISALMELNSLNQMSSWHGHATSNYSKLVWGDKEQIEKFLLKFTYGYDKVFNKGFPYGLKILENGGLKKKVKDISDLYIGIKGNGLSGVYPGKSLKGVGLAVATSSRGADHLRSLPTLATYATWHAKNKGLWTLLLDVLKMPLQSLNLMKGEAKLLAGNFYKRYTSLFGVPKDIVDTWKELGFLENEKQYTGWWSMIKFTQEMYALSDAVSMCRFVSPWRFGIGPELLSEVTTELFQDDMGWKDLLAVGERIYAMERELLWASGESDVEDTLPQRFFKSRKNPDGICKNGFARMLQEYHTMCGYNSKGRPTEKTLYQVNDNFVAIDEIKHYIKGL